MEKEQGYSGFPDSRASVLNLDIREFGLFTSSNTKKLRTKLEKDLRNGQINIAVGTHSLIQETIEFNNLGAIVIDEQHRFGVKQRNHLKS